ncbi:MAG: DUF4097 family beta strand repeat protein [Clostridia bacterium]|nr:DUF4097 family beta strand repeat protein [Clostridia bacterium]
MRIKAIFRMIFWTVAAVAITSFIVFTMSGAGESFAKSFGILSYDEEGYTEYKGGTLSFGTDEVKSITVDWVSGSVNITRSNENDFTLSETSGSKLKEGQHFKYKLEDGVLNIRFTESKDLFSFGDSTPSKRLEIGVPVPVSKSIENVTVDTVSAMVKISGISAASVKVGSVSGKVDVSGLSAANIEVETLSGAVLLNKDLDFTLEFETTVGTAPEGVESGKSYKNGEGIANVRVKTAGGNLSFE